MPKISMEYTLPEETNELKLAQRGSDYYCIIWGVLQEIRGYLKHGHKFETIEEALEDIRESLLTAPIDDIE